MAFGSRMGFRGNNYVPPLPDLPAPEENTARLNYPVPSAATGIYVTLIGGGGGGGSGADGSGGARSGGGGGGGGATIYRAFIPRSALGSTITVTVGAGGTGGSVSTAANGNPGLAGGASTFSSGSITLSAGGGLPGQGGQRSSTAGTGGNGGAATATGVSATTTSIGFTTANAKVTGSNGTAGGNGGGADGFLPTAVGDGTNAPATYIVGLTTVVAPLDAATGGGGGGGRSALNGRFQAGRGGHNRRALGGLPGLVDTRIAGADGIAGSISPVTNTGRPGTGGGGGAPKSVDYGGTGGAGGANGGGGGGGAGGDVATAGGNGGAGYTKIEWTPSETVFMLGGYASEDSSAAMTAYLSGATGGTQVSQVIQGQNYTRVPYPNQEADPDNDMAAAALILNERLLAAPGHKKVFAHSLGAVAVYRWLKDYASTSTIPVEDLEFVLMGNSVQTYNGFFQFNDWKQPDNVTAFVTPSTVLPVSSPYKIQEMSIQYDWFSDWPDLNPTGPASDYLRSFGGLGIGFHVLYPAWPLERWDYKYAAEGNITYVLMPNPWPTTDQVNTFELDYDRPAGRLSSATIRNKVTNSSFEGSGGGVNTTGRTGVGGTASSSIVLDAANARTGSYSALVTWSAGTTDPAGGGANLFAIENVTVGKQYSCSVWIKSSVTRKYRLNATWFSGNFATNDVMGTETGSITTATLGVWTRLTLTTGAVPSGTASIRLEVSAVSLADGGTNFASGHTLRLDDYMVTEGTTLYDYFDGLYYNDVNGAWTGTRLESASTKKFPT